LDRGEGTRRARERRTTAQEGGESWRAGYVILPLAVVVGLCQLFIPTDLIPSDLFSPHLVPPHRDRAASSEWRPDQAAAATPSDASGFAGTANTGGAIGAAEAAPPPAPPPPPIRVLIHHAAGPRNALPALQLAAYLQVQGFVVEEIRAVQSDVERPSVSYFFESDQPDSDRLVEAVDAFLARAPLPAPARADDFSHASPKPERGSMEVLLPSLAAASESRSS
jgi:hypothetical protein